MATRMDISLNTGNSDDKNAQENYFDQITAISQGIINASFKEMFDRLKQNRVPQMTYNGPMGNIDGVLNAPYIMINGTSDSASEIFYVLRIESGDLMFEDGQTRKMHDWEIAVRTKLSDATYEDLPGDPARVRKRKEKWRSDIANKYPGFRAGEYSVQRVFCAIGSAEWDRYNEDLSTVWDPLTKSRIHLSAWLSRATNELYTEHILSLLRGWAREQEETNSSTMGIKFSLKSEIVNEVTPTFRPVFVYNQTYPYVKPGTETGALGYGDYDKRDETHPYGQLDPGDYNCLLYCENVDRMNGEGPGTQVSARLLPVNKRMGFNGNLAQPGPPFIPGSFVMDHRVFMTTFLLPQMQELCLATYMQVGVPEQYFKVDTESKVICPNYAIGCQLKGDIPKAADDKFFKIERVSQNADRDQPRFVWKKFSEQDGLSANKVHVYTIDGAPDMPLGYGNYWIRADSEVEVNWMTGTPTLNVSGRITYDYRIAFADEKDMRNPREVKYVVTATWSFAIVMRNVTIPINNDKGEKIGEAKVLRPCIENLTNGYPANTKVVSNQTVHHSNITSHTMQAIEKRLKITLEQGMRKIIANVSRRFDHTGKLSYPGHGELEFQDPAFTRLGNLIATIKYKKPSIGEEKMYFPNINPKTLVITQPSLPTAQTSSFKANLQHHRNPRLEWYHHLKYNEKTRIGRLIIRGMNRKSDGKGDELLLAFRLIRISLIHTPSKDEATGEERSNKLFSEAPFELESRPGLMEQFFKDGKALFIKLVKVFLPSTDEGENDAKSIQRVAFVSSSDIEVAEENKPSKSSASGPDTSANTTSNVNAIPQVKEAPEAPEAPVAPIDSPLIDSENSPLAPTDSITELPVPFNSASPQVEEALVVPINSKSPPAAPVDSASDPVAPDGSAPTSSTITPSVLIDSTSNPLDPIASSDAPAQNDVSNKQATNLKSPVSNPQSSHAKAPKPRKPKMKEVEKKVETWKPSTNTYSFRPWDQDEDIEDRILESTTQVKTTISIDRSTRAIEIVLRPTFGDVKDATESAAKGFVIPSNQDFELQLQGSIEHLGQYAIKIQEEWCKIEDEEIKTDANAIDYKMIDLKFVDNKQKVVVDEYDLSDRMEEEKKRDQAEKAIQQAAEEKKAAMSQGK